MTKLVTSTEIPEILCWRWRTINNRNGEEKETIAELFFLSDHSDHMETRLKLSAMDKRELKQQRF